MDVLTMGVEEEYLLVDRVSRAPVNRAPKVISALEGLMGEQVQAEFYNAQVEVCTVPTADRADLREQLVRLRGTVAPSASEVGCLLVASGVPVIAPQEPLTVTDNERYRRMARRFASLVGPSRMVCGCHVHVGALDRKRALALSNHIRPWLPVLQSLTGNSPSNAAVTRASTAGGRSPSPPGPPWDRPRCWTSPGTWNTSTAWSAPECCSTAACSIGTPGPPSTCRRWSSGSPTSTPTWTRSSCWPHSYAVSPGRSSPKRTPTCRRPNPRRPRCAGPTRWPRSTASTDWASTR